MTTTELRNVLDQHKCWLAGANPTRANLVHADLAGANLTYADLAGANLAGANLAHADLTRASLVHTDLAHADLTRASLTCANLARVIGLPPAPVVADLDAKILAAISNGAPRLGDSDSGPSLSMGAWHTCETTHCRAGWAIHLAGDAGRQLENKLGSNVAGALIYAASRPGMPVPNFFATNEDALADIQRCAAASMTDTRCTRKEG